MPKSFCVGRLGGARASRVRLAVTSSSPNQRTNLAFQFLLPAIQSPANDRPNMRIDASSVEKLERFKIDFSNNRAYEIAMQAFLIHSFMTEKAEDNETIDFMCSVNGKEIMLGSVGPFLADFIYIESLEEEDGTTCSFFTQIDQVTFVYVVSPKKSGEPPREIGFHTTIKKTSPEQTA